MNTNSTALAEFWPFSTVGGLDVRRVPWSELSLGRDDAGLHHAFKVATDGGFGETRRLRKLRHTAPTVAKRIQHPARIGVLQEGKPRPEPGRDADGEAEGHAASPLKVDRSLSLQAQQVVRDRGPRQADCAP